MGFTIPTPVQQEVIPVLLDGKDCLAQAPTGTGKTCAFGLPLVEKIDADNSLVQGLVLCPTRELAMQIERELKKIASNTPVRITALYGGENIEKQMAALRRKPHIVVGTPGRVIDHIRRKTLKLHGTTAFILDEADEMLDMGFRGDIEQIEKKLPSIRQTALLSATMPKEIMEISAGYQLNPVKIKTTVGESEVPQIKQLYVKLSEDKKYEAFKRILREKDFKFVLVFCNTKARVDALYEKLDGDGYLCAGLHGDLKQRFRDKIMKAYRAKQLNVLVATDVAARGIDVDGVEAIFNYDVPLDEEFYVHRIGRTARANKTGEAISFVTKKDIYRLNLYEKLTKTPIEELILDGLSEGFTAKNKKEETVKLFLNLGTKDRINDAELRKFVSVNSSLSVDEIKNVKVLELYSFFEVKAEYLNQALAVSGAKHSGRFITVEQAGKEKQSGGIKNVYGKSKDGKEKSGNKAGNKNSAKAKKSGSKTQTNKPDVEKKKNSALDEKPKKRYYFDEFEDDYPASFSGFTERGKKGGAQKGTQSRSNNGKGNKAAVKTDRRFEERKGSGKYKAKGGNGRNKSSDNHTGKSKGNTSRRNSTERNKSGGNTYRGGNGKRK
ncbi:MAG: DEAD/DEAH box helicase [Christensenellales bacterium]